MKELTREQAKAALPTQDRVIIQLDRPKGLMLSGLYLPDALKKKDAYGRIIKTGPGKRLGKKRILCPLMVQPGDIVLLPKWYDVNEGELKDETFLIGREDELLAVVGKGTRVSIV